MSDIDLKTLKAALVAEGVKLKEEILDRVFRKLANPSGCEHCGQHVKVGVQSGNKIVTACCGAQVGSVPAESSEGA